MPPDDTLSNPEITPSRGGAVDRFGNEVVDPTRNVLDLVQAAVKRLDDLRDVENRRIEDKLRSEKEHVKEIMDLRANYEEKLRQAESKRIDAIRVVDVQAVQTANDKATAQAQVLATQVTASAETLRTLVATSATALATQQTQIITPITDRISLLEKAQYEGAGKERATDPQMSQLISEVRNLTASNNNSSGKNTQQQDNTLSGRATTAVGLSIFGSLLGLITLIYLIVRTATGH